MKLWRLQIQLEVGDAYAKSIRKEIWFHVSQRHYCDYFNRSCGDFWYAIISDPNHRFDPRQQWQEKIAVL